jgi:hypothetical protein
LHHFSQFEGTQ